MKIKGIIFIILIGFRCVAIAQEKLEVFSNINDYRNDIISNPAYQLVEISKAIPTIKLDIKYATTHNFSGVAVYKQARAFARKPVVDALKEIQLELKNEGLGLKIFDAYRPYSVTVKFWKVTPLEKKEFVANPKTGSRHNRGCAVDLTLINLKTGNELEMPTAYDSFAAEASPTYEDVSALQKQNRDLLIKIMESNGFKVIKNEWWHYDFKGWDKFPLMDIPFEKL
ncbi:MAG: M15 family metallopeptidase [Bacteroidetes bacterium]|nr:M15 family metallopeptidase [Bacteroidota bacterium]MBU1374160.1 M15 family metallopeptidase [Bacteroidota bacterium]MBU1484727.1 M15 family metallopeptidase [Bacteroidota bacterium]MBU1761862.1 M15 family metallopeptidase [Bacteroidota bacterium]MBU2267290.1 M15 family metallopeptidase [Bacteroidota bacterium]